MFEQDGDRFVPGPICTGPWDPATMHGGPPFALCGRILAGHGEGSDAFHLARLSVELVRAVPMRPLTVEVIETRAGRRIQLLDVILRDDTGLELVYGRAMRIRRADNGLDEAELPMPGPPTHPTPDESAVFEHGYPLDEGGFYMDAFEIRTCDERSFGPPGASAAWFRLRTPVLAGDAISPLDRVLAVSDFGNGISNIVPGVDHLYINPDVSLHLQRVPEGEWLLSDARTHARRDGHGTATAVLSDQRGQVGVANQSLMIAPRP